MTLSPATADALLLGIWHAGRRQRRPLRCRILGRLDGFVVFRRERIDTIL